MPPPFIALQAWHRHIQPPANLPFCVTPSVITTWRGTGILTCCPSATPFGLTLGPTNPTRIDLPSETLDFRGLRFSRSSRYSCQHSHFRSLHDSFRYRFDAPGTLAYCTACSHTPHP